MEENNSFPEKNTLYIRKELQRMEELKTKAGNLYILGDPIYNKNVNLADQLCNKRGTLDEDALYEHVKGHYYWFLLQGQDVKMGTSFGSIFPIYYYQDTHHIEISSASFHLAERLNGGTRSKRNLLERLLFNYPFFNSTWWEEIHLLPAHRQLHLSAGRMNIDGNFDISDHFGQVMAASRQKLSDLTACFADETALFFPEAPFAISLTGGFDGRTLVAAAQKAGKSFITYSFGVPTSSDVALPKMQAQKLGIPYFPIYLDEEYVTKESAESARAFMDITEYNGNFGRPHYYYAARKLSKQVDYIITGNFGSELFRALHLPGVMMSAGLINIFAANDNSWKDYLYQEATKWDKNFFTEELEALIADLETYLDRMKGWDSNHKFYYFVWNEIFRKYFGPELIMQSHFLNNRTPYLNLAFFKVLNRTPWAGVHARLFEQQKSRRMKGQFFYSTFLRQASPGLYHLKTNKGYTPADVLEPWRLPLLAGKVIAKKYLKSADSDNNAVDTFFQMYHNSIADMIQSNNNSSFLLKMLNQSSAEITQGKNLESWIKLYSIAAGWEAAAQNTVTSV